MTLFDLVKTGDLDEVKKVIVDGADVNETFTLVAETALMRACFFGHCEIVEYLIFRGADINKCDTHKRTALQYALKHIDIVKLLLDYEIDMDMPNKAYFSYISPISIAAKKRYVEVFEYLVDNGADLSEADITLFAKSGSLRLLKQHVNAQNINKIYNMKYTALLCAVENDNIEIVVYLLENGADPNLKVRYEVTAIMRAKTAECAKLLIDAGAQVNAKDDSDYTALQFAGMHRDLALIKVLVENGADVNHKIKDKYPLLDYVAKYGRADIFKYLVENGADCTHMSFVEFARAGQYEKVKTLIEDGADVNMDFYSKTAMHCACENGFIDIVRLLMEHGAKLKVKDSQNNTPLILACANGNLDIVSLILSKSTKDAKDKQNQTALHHAIIGHHLEVIKLLIENGVKTNILDKYTNYDALGITKSIRESILCIDTEEIYQEILVYLESVI